MNRRWVTSSKEYQNNFEFLADGTARANAAYHFQYIEHCLRHRDTLESTTRSLTNRTIIVELGSIVEMVLYELLSGLQVNLPNDKKSTLLVEDYFTLGKLIQIAQYYELIDEKVKKLLDKLNTNRNSIHFKKHTKNRILEYDYYTDEMVEENCTRFRGFLDCIYQHYLGKQNSNFTLPWEKYKNT